MTAPLAGGTSATLSSRQKHAFAIAVDGTSAYWTDFDAAGSVMKVPLSGGTPATLASMQTFPYAVVVDAGNVYWITDDQKGNGTVLKASK